MIIDVHTHIFSKVNGRIKAGKTNGIGYGRVNAGNEIVRILPPLNAKTCHTAQMLIENMDMVGVNKAVLLQGSFYGENNSYVLEATRMYPERLVAVAFLDPWSSDALKNFEFILENKEFIGVKLECSENNGFFGLYDKISLSDRNLKWLWQEMEKNSLVLVLDLGSIGSRSYQTVSVKSIASEYPGLKIVIAHLAQPSLKMENDSALYNMWIEQIDIGKLNNVWFDTAALPSFFPLEVFPYKSAQKYFRIAIERIGANKIMFGTDIPWLLIYENYNRLINLLDIYTNELNKNEKDKIKYCNAIDVYFANNFHK